MRRSLIGSLATLGLVAVCAVGLSMASIGCTQNKGSATQMKSSAGCPKDCQCAKKGTADCPRAGKTACPCNEGECKCGKGCKCAKKGCVCRKGECPKDCKCVKKGTGECPKTGKKPCACKKAKGTCPKAAEKAGGE